MRIFAVAVGRYARCAEYERGCVKAVLYHSAYLISKESLAKFLCSDMGQLIVNKSDFHGELIVGFIEGQKNSDIAFGTMSL